MWKTLNKPIDQPRGVTKEDVVSVVLVLGVLMVVVLPPLIFKRSNPKGREAILIKQLKVMRTQIELFKSQHSGISPGQGATTSQALKDALLLSTDDQGVAGPVGSKPYGPYFKELPRNPYTDGRGVLIVPAPISAATPNESMMDGTEIVGWIYSPSEGLIRANNKGNAANGTPLFNL